MNWIITTEEIHEGNRQRVGGKGFALSRLAKAGFTVPETLYITSDAYQDYLNRAGLRERILLELHRKDFREMRWEEVWDCAVRIRNMFMTSSLPMDMGRSIRHHILDHFQDNAVAVRSSAIDEDARQTSFAGLHESFINVKGADSILESIRRVWASLWSDAALLYRQETGLDVEKSAMAVVVQKSVAGESSGVVFTRSPNDESQAVVESVHGLNQGLVDGDIEPDRWTIDRSSRKIVTHASPLRKEWLVPGAGGICRARLPSELADRPPLTPQAVRKVLDAALKVEAVFNSPQDMEWTFRGKILTVLQSRPITTLRSNEPGDQRGWYLSLHRSFDNLKKLRLKIESELIPGMIKVADELGAVDLKALSDESLALEIKRRRDINHRWTKTYWAEFIPYAHGVRLFGQVYNDTVKPENPYEFMDLLIHTGMAGIRRNNMLINLAERVRRDPALARQLERGDTENLDAGFAAMIHEFVETFGDLSCAVTGGSGCVSGTGPLYRLLLEMAAHPPRVSANEKSNRSDRLLDTYIGSFDPDRKAWARELLDLARNSYRLRDDDNIYLGRIEARLLSAIQEAERRLSGASMTQVSEDLQKVLSETETDAEADTADDGDAIPAMNLRARQLTGQPAGPGIARGKARVIRKHADLAGFRHGEVLVCDAVDPNMTFVVPLAAAVVERRGGMLIHGAIIAREYGLPCITGVPDATSRIHTGDAVTVDGYLGIVTLGDSRL